MEAKYVFQVKNPIETKDLAGILAKYLIPGTVLTLEGDLGAGKTTFVQGLAKGLDIKGIVNSPTFTIIKQYQGRLPLNHMDVYRMEDGVEDIGFDDFFYSDGVTVVEWASIIKEYLPEEYCHIEIRKTGEEHREIIFYPKGKSFKDICEEFIKDENISN